MQAPLPTMTLSHIFDVAGLQLSGIGGPAAEAAQQAHVQAVPGPLLGPAPASLQPPASRAPHPASLHAQSLPVQRGMPAVPSLPHAVPLHMQAAAPLLPPGLTPAGPFASGSLTMSLPPGPASLPAPASQPASLPPAAPQPASMPPGGPASQGAAPTKAPAAAARAARAKKRKDASTSAAAAAAAEARPAGGLTAAEAARQAKAVAERAAAELQQLPADLDDKEARAIKRAVRACWCITSAWRLPCFALGLELVGGWVGGWAWQQRSCAELLRWLAQLGWSRPPCLQRQRRSVQPKPLHTPHALCCAADQEPRERGPLARQAPGVHRHAGAKGG